MKLSLCHYLTKSNPLSSKVVSTTAHSHKKKEFLVSASSLKYNDSYTSSINCTNLPQKGLLLFFFCILFPFLSVM